MRYISDVIQQEVLTLSSSKAALRKGRPQCQLYGIEGKSVLIEEGATSGIGRCKSPSRTSPAIDYSEIAKSARKLQGIMCDRVGKPPQDVIMSVRVVHADRAMFIGEAHIPQKESHLTQSLLKVVWKTRDGCFASGERLVDFSRFDVGDTCDRICEAYDEEGFRDILAEGYRDDAILFLPAEITAGMIKACVGGIVRFGSGVCEELPVSYCLLDCSEYNGMELAHSFDVVGQCCEPFDVRVNLSAYRFAQDDDGIRTPYGTSLREPGRLTFSSGPRAIIAKGDGDLSDVPECDYRITSMYPTVHERYSSGSLLSFVLEGRESRSGELARFRVRGYPVDLLERLRLTSDISIFSYEGFFVGAGSSVLSV